jgi:hypothetical protein
MKSNTEGNTDNKKLQGKERKEKGQKQKLIQQVRVFEMCLSMFHKT